MSITDSLRWCGFGWFFVVILMINVVTHERKSITWGGERRERTQPQLMNKFWPNRNRIIEKRTECSPNSELLYFRDVRHLLYLVAECGKVSVASVVLEVYCGQCSSAWSQQERNWTNLDTKSWIYGIQSLPTKLLYYGSRCKPWIPKIFGVGAVFSRYHCKTNSEPSICSFFRSLNIEYTGWVDVSIRKEIDTIVNTFSKNKYGLNRQYELMK